ncbi:PREDICTED: ribonuclease P protein subunit p30 [Papilio polytes]|uniref:ribonuclease P protein subunit p30 n=1 Tax=Papilio polytes TaxID=76194 RepID=UPI0006768BB2|nr:PREDICTED: ribonuclease P protein subunit p30 [Papilio polytes]
MAQKNWGFCDLSVSRDCDITKISCLQKLGLNTVAINTHVEEISDEPKKKKRKGETKEKKDFVPNPVDIPKDLNKGDINILQRVTIEFSESSISHKFNHSENLRKYDIIAVIPKTLQAFQYACSSLDVDIITFDPQTRLPFKVSRKLYNQAVERGLFFELMYSPAIKDSTARRNIISMAHSYFAVGKSNNIIISSGADNYHYIRGVHDVINLGFIFGMNSNQSLDSIRNNTRRLIIKAEGRRCGRHYLVVTHDKEKVKHKE